MRSPVVILIGNLALALTVGAQEDTMMICDFEDAAQCKRFVTLADNRNSMTHNTDPKYVGSGSGSARFFTPPAGKGEHQWPRATVTLPEAKRDWRLYDEYRMTIINPAPGNGRLTMSAISVSGKQYPRYHLPVPPGKSEFVWALPDSIRDEKIAQIRFVCGSSAVENTVYLDDIRLCVSDATLKNSLEALERRINREIAPGFWQQADMAAELAAQHRAVNELRNSTARPLERSQRALNQLQEYQKLKTKLWARLCARASAKFDQRFPTAQVWGYGWCSGADKVYRAELPYSGSLGGAGAVALARREREGVQLVLRSHRKLNDVNVTVAAARPLSGSAGSVPEVTSLLVGHVRPPMPSYPVEPATWRPDPLLPFADKFELEPDVWQAIWLDVHAAPECPAGDYECTITVRATGAPELTVPLRIRVWDFTLPEFPTQPALVNYHSDSNHFAYLERKDREKVGAEFIAYRRGQRSEKNISAAVKRLRELEIATETLLLEHKITPAPLYITQRRLQVADVRRWRNGGGRCFSVTYLPPQTAKTGGTFAPWVEKMVLNNLAATVPALQKAGLLEDAYCYGFDEITHEKFVAAKTLMTTVKAAYPDLRIVTTTEDRDFGRKNGLDRLVDVWCPQIERYVEQIDLVREIRKTGKKIWFYSCCYDPGMDMLLEKPLNSVRLLCGLAQIKYEADGFLYYGVTSGNRHQSMIESGPLTQHTANNRSSFNGCGVLVYPTVKGPASSLRLKAMRDGFEDVEYWHLLKKLDPADLTPEAQAELKRLLTVPASVIADLEVYDQTGDATLKFRRAAGELLHQHHTFKVNE